MRNASFLSKYRAFINGFLVFGSSACVDLQFIEYIDQDAPRPPAVEIPGTITLIRTPGGLDAQTSSVTMMITGDIGATEPYTTLRIYDLENNLLHEEITNGQGGFGPIALSARDQRTLEVSSVDEKNNESEQRPIQEIIWRPRLTSALSTGRVSIELLAVPNRDGSVADGLSSGQYHLPLEKWDNLREADNRTIVLKEKRIWRRLPYLSSEDDRGPLQGRVAYDRRRGRVVSFCSLDAKTWEWDGYRWSKLLPEHAPEDRILCNIVFDPRHNRTLMFGGYSSQPPKKYFGDLWSWNGLDWEQIPQDKAPIPRASPLLAYDSHRGSVFLFGGFGENKRFNDFWELNGDTWSRIPDQHQNWPEGCYEGAMSYDPYEKQLVMYCSQGANSSNMAQPSKTWIWNGIQWTDHSVPEALRFCENSTILYDESQKQLVLWGCEEPGSNLLPMWVWNGAQWELSQEFKESSTEVPILSESQLVFDTKNNKTLAVNRQYVWALKNKLWRPSTPSLTHPSGRSLSRAEYDPELQRIVLFGGLQLVAESSTITEPLNDTWVFEGQGWHRIDTSSMPPRRYGAGFAYDLLHKHFVLMSGVLQQVTPEQAFVLADVWYLRNDTWEFQGFLSSYDCVRAYHQLLWNPQYYNLVVWGGFGLHDEFVHGRILNGLQCSDLPSTSMSTRIEAASAFDSLRQVWWFFGGKDREEYIHNDLWIWDGNNWSSRETQNDNSWPSARFGAAMVYDENRQRTMLYGGLRHDSNDSGFSEEGWEWDGNSWHQMEFVGEHPGPRALHSLVYSPADRATVLFGGQQSQLNIKNIFPDDTWLLPSRAGGPALQITIDLHEALIDFRALTYFDISIGGQGHGHIDELAVEFWDQWKGAWIDITSTIENSSGGTRLSFQKDHIKMFVTENEQKIRFRIRSRGVTRGEYSESVDIDFVQIEALYREI